MLLKDILRDLPNYQIDGSLDFDVKNIYYDSRRVTQDSLFICIQGLEFDGHNFIDQAVQKGARVIVANQGRDIHTPAGVNVVYVPDTRRAMADISKAFYGNPGAKLRLMGVTGTNGKTTTTYMVKAILDVAGGKNALLGTINNIIGNRVIKTEMTTPESMDLQRLLRLMVDEGVQNAIMEVSSHSLEMGRVEGCHFDVGVFTNITQDHLDFHKTFDNYLKAKIKLFEKSKNAAINIDDPNSGTIIKNVRCDVTTYGIDKKADVYAKDIVTSNEGTRFTLVSSGGQRSISLKIPGMFSVYNALAATACCSIIGIDMDTIKLGLENIPDIPGRFQTVNAGQPYTVIIDYAHTPDGLENVLKTIKGFAEGNIITVFGCGGDRDATKRPIMGRVAGQYSDICILTSDNPRSEEPLDIIKDIEKGITETKCLYRSIENRREAIREALAIAKEKDVVLIAGKGHETYQIIKDKTIHFDDREVVKELLEGELCRGKNDCTGNC